MPVSENLEAALVAEEVAAPGETAVPVDLSAVSLQLDNITALETAQVAAQCVLIGLVLGAVVALIVGRLWK